jgi:hypothetical protein
MRTSLRHQNRFCIPTARHQVTLPAPLTLIYSGAGAHSPSFVTGRQSPQSPTRENTSSFTGDKRSYELVSEVMKQLLIGNKGHDNQNESLFADMRESFLAVNVAVEKCNLLVSMLHHQLKHVTYRTTDPSRSRVLSRETGSTRLKPKKMAELLQALGVVYRQYVAGLEGRPPPFLKIKEYHSTRECWVQRKRNITVRLLTAILLLHQGLKQSTPDHLTGVDIYLPGFQMSVDSLRAELSLLESGAESELLFGNFHENQSKLSSSPTGRLSTSQAIIQVCLRLLRYVTPLDVAALATSEFHLWEEHIRASGVVPLVLSVLQVIFERGKSLIQRECSYDWWEDTTCISSSGMSSKPAHLWSQRSHEGPGGTSPPSWEILDCVIEYILSEGMKSKSLLFQNLIRNGLLTLLSESSMFRELQRLVCLETVHRAAAFMGYSALTAEVSSILSIWCKIVQIMQCALR